MQYILRKKAAKIGADLFFVLCSCGAWDGGLGPVEGSAAISWAVRSAGR